MSNLVVGAYCGDEGKGKKVEYRDATFSPCRRYRYTLTRRWLTGRGTIVFVMLNPSTADAEQDDLTIRRCIAYAKAWGYRKLIVLNIFALRATDPRELYRASDPVGPDNYAAFRTALLRADRVICAWGNHGTFRDQGATAYHWIRQANHRPYALKLTKKGMPVHPRSQPRDIKPFPITIVPDAVRPGFQALRNPERY